jgi:hypothetical protein
LVIDDSRKQIFIKCHQYELRVLETVLLTD